MNTVRIIKREHGSLSAFQWRQDYLRDMPHCGEVLTGLVGELSNIGHSMKDIAISYHPDKHEFVLWDTVTTESTTFSISDWAVYDNKTHSFYKMTDDEFHETFEII